MSWSRHIDLPCSIVSYSKHLSNLAASSIILCEKVKYSVFRQSAGADYTTVCGSGVAARTCRRLSGIAGPHYIYADSSEYRDKK